MESNVQFRYGDEVYYIILDVIKKRYTYRRGKIVGQVNEGYRIQNTDANEKALATIQPKFVYRSLPNLQMDIMFLNGELKNGK